MRLQIAKIFIDETANTEGFIVKELENGTELFNSENNLQIKIKDDTIETTSEGAMNAVLERSGKMAVLPKNSKGKVYNGDKIWLLNEEAKKEFERGKREEIPGAGVKIIVQDEKNNEEREDIYINEKGNFLEKNNRSFNVILGAIIFLLLIGGTFLGYQKKTSGEALKKITAIKQNWQQEKTEIESVRSINPETALTIAQKAENEVLTNSQSLNKKYSSEVENIKTEISEIKKSLGDKSVDYEIAYDTTLIADSGEYMAMTSLNNIVYLWGQKSGQIETVDISLKSTDKLVNDERIKNWLGIFYSGDKWYGYDQNKIYEIKRGQLIETEICKVTGISQANGWNGIIYVVDNSEKMIKKIVNNEGQDWLKNSLNLEEEINGIAIDTNIWTLGKSGKIYEYSRGQKVNFNMSFTPNLTSAKKIVTNDKINFLAYIGNENTVIIYGKDGKILGEYNFDNQKILDLGIDVPNNAVLVLSSNDKIYRIKIK